MGSRMKKSSLIRIIAMLLVTVVSFSALTACRDSDAFTQLVYNQNSEEETDDDELMDNDEENVDNPDEDVFSVSEDISDALRDYENAIAQVGEGYEGYSKNVLYSSDGTSFYTSSQTRDSSSSGDEEGLDTTEGDNDSEAEDGDYGSDGTDDDASGSSSTGTSDTSDVSNEDTAGSEDETAENVEIDPDEEVNEDIPTGTTAAAIGEIAVLVQMLGGDGTLIVTADSFKTAMVSGINAATVFSDELADDLIYLGDIDSFSEMSTTMFEALVEAAPDIIFMTTDDYDDWSTYYNSLSSANRLAFTEAGIEIVKLQDLTTGSSSLSAGDALLYDIEVIGESLGDRTEYGGQDAEALADAYADWYSETLGLLSSGGGLYSCYIDDWDDDAVMKVSNSGNTYSTASEGGMAIAYLNLYLSASFYMDAAGVTATNSLSDCMKEGAGLYYVNTLKNNLDFKISGGLSESVYLLKQSHGTNKDYLLTETTSGSYLGSDVYPALLVSKKSIKTKIEYSRDNGGLFSTSLTRDYFDYAGTEDIQAVASTDYDVYVVPYGVGSWADGSAESPLFALWVAYKFYGSVSEDTLIYLTQSFYSEFYRYTLSESQAKTILAGRTD